MSVENKNKEDRFVQNKNFFKEYHDKVISSGRVGSNPNIGGNITMFITGTNIDGKEYLIPLYNPETGEVEGTPYQVELDGEMKTFYRPNKKAIQRAREYIAQGLISGYEKPEEAETDRSVFYPQIVN
tara:strand:+ start:2031 stop:2411 length:381 start_codon:yes stop_codon:yes gene_type:complete